MRDGAVWRDRIHPDDRDRVLAEVEHCRRTGEPRLSEYRLRHRNGQELWVHDEARIVRDAHGQSLFLQGIMRDVTQQKLAEANLHASARQWQTTFDSIIDCVALIGLDRHVLKCNQAMADLVGRSPEDVVGRLCDELLACPWAGNDGCPVSRMQQTRHRECVLRAMDDRWFSISADPLLDETGRPVGAVHILRDVTEQKQAEQRIHEYQRDLRSLASQLSLTEERERRRIAGALHDQIGQTLALSKIKLGALRKLATNEELALAVDELRELIGESIDYTRTLVFDLSPPILYEMGLGPALERLAENVHRRYRLRTEFVDDGQPKPLADDVRVVLFQSGRELLMNVVKHANADHAKVTVRREDSDILVTVQDEGVGFDPGETRLHARRDGGFGLFHIRERLDHLGGRFDLWSRPGKGTVATLVAPLRQDTSD